MKIYKSKKELIRDMAGRTNVWTAIEEMRRGYIRTNGYWTREWKYEGNGIVIWGAKTQKEMREKLKEIFC
jgi:hypothetical protein